MREKDQIQLQVITDWCENYHLTPIISFPYLDFEGVGRFRILEDRDPLITSEFKLALYEDEKNDNVKGYVFQFGECWYYVEKDLRMKVILNPLVCIGQQHEEPSFSPLAIHGEYEVLNGSGSYVDWARAVSFLGFRAAAITELNTLGGTLKFQTQMKKKNVKPIIGEQVTVRGDMSYRVKLYCINDAGWRNLLSINYTINVDESSRSIPEEYLLSHLDGLVVVLDPKWMRYDVLRIRKFKTEHLFYQIDSVEFENNSRDREYLENLKEYLYSTLQPVLISDAYYIEKNTGEIKEILNTISSIREHKSFNQHLKTLNEEVELLLPLFKEEEFETTFLTALENVTEIVNLCEFQIPIEVRKFPNYNLTEEEKEKYGTSEKMLTELVNDGMKQYFGNAIPERYVKQVQYELSIIKNAEMIDYFLILWDVYRYCREHNILTGLGRGSSAGALTTFFLHLTRLDPLKYGLLFERFMNPGRVTKEVIEDRVVVNDKKSYGLNDKVKIVRDDQIITVKAADLREGDEIIDSR